VNPEYRKLVEDNASTLTKQVGGTHYEEQAIQPLEYTYAIYGWDGVKASVHTKVNKYLTRDKVNEIEDIDKAIHCLELLKEFYYGDT
jgi:hypothetical protein